MSRMEQLKQFLKEQPDDPFMQYCIALEYIKTGEKKEGLKWFGNLQEQHPDYVATYYHKGKLLESMGKKDLAEQTYARGMEVAQRQQDHHAFSELQGARNELVNDFDVEFDD